MIIIHKYAHAISAIPDIDQQHDMIIQQKRLRELGMYTESVRTDLGL